MLPWVARRSKSTYRKAAPPCTAAYDDAMKAARTAAWWWSRLELTIAVVVIAVEVSSLGPYFEVKSGNPATVPGLPSGVVVLTIGFTLAIGGLVWMLRIVRGPRDEPPRWRYRAGQSS